MTLLVVGALSYVIYWNVYDLLAHAAESQKPRKPVNVNDAIKTTVTILTLIGAVLAGIYAYRKQRLAEGDAHRSDASQLADRYTTAAEQLGHDQAAVRLAGVYALARLADDWAEQRQVCIDVLCAYLRMPYEADPAAPGHKEGEREVRQTINRVIRDHLVDPDADVSWCEFAFDFTGASFDRTIDFSSVTFSSSVTFGRATFSGTVSFGGTTFSGSASFGRARFSSVDFAFTTFDGNVDFGDATFSSIVHFGGATFSGDVDLTGATFESVVEFGSATFGGIVEFGSATFGGIVDFEGATFSRGTVDFEGATFRNTVHLGATFGGSIVNFRRATFGGVVGFGGATFSRGTVDFEGATFTDAVDLSATFEGTEIRWGPLPRPAGA
ncbi:pentapeptide repeat-containing protein [Streptomyces sp. NBC_01478]|uniref:pentapeptide repeat-containing protein n=1 Tax=Streptomyces sp. NBC_01478 TaxID=2903882 RepID=UPI002E303142|nr:pentapeptide repeat-containing protein [Streptomyces sp. NBC_01478]